VIDWWNIGLRTAVVLIVFLVMPLLVGQTEHKVMAHMQGRLGPMYAGGFHGWAQLVADGVKFVQKEDITPRAADRWVFKLAPAVALVPYLVALAVIPLSPTVVAADVDAGVLFVLAASAVGILGILMAGWSSANKYALLGGMRAAAQLLSYELPLVLSVASVALAAGTLSLTGIADAWHPLWLLWQLPGAFVFLIAAWQLSGLFMNQIFISTPAAIVAAFAEILADGTLIRKFADSAVDMGVGIVIASIIGIGLGVLMGRSPRIERAFEPIVNFAYV